MKGVEVRARSVGLTTCRAVLGHAAHTGVPRDTPMAKALSAVDELRGSRWRARS